MVSIFIVPQVAFAAWWNPLSWSVWNIFKPTPKVQQVQIATTTPTTPTATTTRKAETNTKQDTPKDNKDSLISSLKKQVADLTQKVSQPKVETPKTSVITLPSGAVVEMDGNGNIIRTITAAPQQTYTAPAPTTQNQPTPAPTPAASAAPVSRTLSVSSPLSGIPEWHVRRGQSSAKVHEFRLSAGGNTATNISAVRVAHFDLGSFSNLWVGTADGTALGGKITVETSHDGSGNVTIPFSTTLNPNVAQNLVIYADIAPNAPQGTINQMYLIDVLSDAGGAFGLPLTGPAVKTDYPPEPSVFNVVLGFSGSVINHLEFTSDQDIYCGNNNTLTKTCVLDGQREILYNLGICSGTLRGAYYELELGKTYICEIYAPNVDGVAAHYKHTFTVE